MVPALHRLSFQGGLPGILAACLVLLPVLAPLAAGQDEAEPADRVSSRLTVSLGGNLDRVFLGGVSYVHRVESGPLQGFCGNASSCAADDLRRLYADLGPTEGTALVSIIEKRAEEAARAALEKVAGGTEGVSVFARLDPADLAKGVGGDPERPPLPIHLEGRAPLSYLSSDALDADGLQALFAMGARFDAPVAATIQPGNELDLTFRVPEPLSVLASTQGTIEPDDPTRVSWHVNNLGGTAPVELADGMRIGRADIVVPTREDAEVDVTLDLSEMSANMARLLANNGVVTVNARVTVNATIRALAAPEPLGSLAGLPSLSADALRLALDAGLFPRERLNASEDGARETLDRVFRDSFGVGVPLEGGFLNESLALEALGEPPGTGGPIRLLLEGQTRFPFPGPPEEPAGVPGLTLRQMSLPGAIAFPAITGLGNATIRLNIVLPPGLDLQFGEASEGVTVTETSLGGGRRAVTIENDGGPAAVAGGQVVVEHGVLWSLLWPLTLLGVLLVVAVPVLVWAVVDVKRQEKRTGRIPKGATSPTRTTFSPARTGTNGESRRSGGDPPVQFKVTNGKR